MSAETSKKAKITVLCQDEASVSRAIALAKRLALPFSQEADISFPGLEGFLLEMTPEGLSLKSTPKSFRGAIKVDFVAGAANHRRLYGGGKGQMIAKAVGIKSGFKPSVLDTTAGLGGDAFVLASLGCRVTLLERVDVIHALLEDGLIRLQSQEDSELVSIGERMQLAFQSGQQYLSELSDGFPDVIYLDPMFPERAKSAQVKKEMQAFQVLAGGDEDATELLELARGKAVYRVVVKRPRKAAPLGDIAPSYQLIGKSTRFDIYTNKAMPEKMPLPGEETV